MRNFKRTLALVLALIMIVGTFATVSAAKAVWYDEAVEMLDNLGISNIGNTADEPITRNEFVLWIAKIETTQMSDNAWKEKVNSVVFSDVTDDHYNAAIAYAHKLEYIEGNGDGTFGPEDTLLLGELSAIVTRLMRYEYLLIGVDEGHWALPYFAVAARNCNAFDQVFFKNTDTSNMDYQLNKGEAAYVLYTICNMANLDNNDSNDIAAKDLILTDEGINLGTKLEGLGNSMARSEMYYITALEQKFDTVASAAVGTGTGSFLQVAGHPAGSYSNSVKDYYYSAPFLTNKLTDNGYVTLVNFDKDSVIMIANDEFLKALRVSLGLDAVRDYLNEEAEINILDYVNVGSMIDLNSTLEFVSIKEYNADADNVDITSVKGINLITSGADRNDADIDVAVIDDYRDLSEFNVNENALIVDTYLKMLAGAEQYVGVSALEVYDSKVHTNNERYILGGLSASATVENAVSWSDVKNMKYTYEAGVEKTYVSSAVLTFKGVEYTYDYAEYKVMEGTPAQEVTKKTSAKNSDIEIYDANWNRMPVADAVNKLINVAQGECFAVFYDVDADGEYDKIWVKDSYPFHMAETLEASPAKGTTTLVYSPAAYNGQYVIDAGTKAEPKVTYGDRDTAVNNGMVFNMKMNPVGAVLLDTTVNDHTGAINTDSFNTADVDSSDDEYNVLEVVLLGSNPYTSSVINYDNQNRMPNYYTSVDVATLQNGIIEEVTVKQVKGEEYFVAKIRVGETTTTVKIPATAPTHVTLPVTIAGVTADWQFAAAEWFTFLDDAIEATNDGIAGSDTVNSANTAAWMAGRYVRFATDAENNVVFIGGMIEKSAVGFVANVTKTATGDNTYDVTVVSYALNETSTDASTYLEAKPFKYSDINLSGTSSSSLVNGKIKNFASPAVEFTDAAGTTWAKTQYGGGTVFAYVNKATLNADGTIDVNKDDGQTSEFFFFNGQNPSVDATGKYFVDNKGNKFPMEYVVEKGYTIDTVVTKEVRAAASGSFDYGYKVLYNAIFKQGTLIDEIVDTDGSVITTAVSKNNDRINTVNDLIYVDLRYDDSNAYILAVHFDCTCDVDPATCTAAFHNSYSSKNYYSQSGSVYYGKFGHAFGSSSLRWEYIEEVIVTAVPANLAPVDGLYILAKTENENARVYFKDIKDGVTITAETTGAEIAALIADGSIVTTADKKEAIGYIGTYSVTYGVTPYYTLTTTSSKYTHDTYFEEVYTDNNAKGIAYFEIDASETLMVQLFIGTGKDSKPVVVTTDAEKAEYPLTDYYIDSNGKVFKPLDAAKITYKVDAKGEYIVGTLNYYYNTTSAPSATDVSFENTNNELGLGYVDEKDTSKGYKELAPYVNFSVKDLPEDAEGWFPGKYSVNINGNEYIGVEATNAIVITPSDDGFDITVTNLKALKNTNGLFVTAWDADTTSTTAAIGTIVLLGEMVTEADVPVAPEDPAAGYRLVMLHGDATANVVSTEFDNLWYVVSDKDAYSLPSGEAVGVIKRVYTTYTDAKNASVNLALQGGEWYYIDEDNVVATASNLAKPESKTATIIDATSAGKIVVDTFNGEKEVDISSMPVVFYYLKDGAVTIASGSTSVNVLDATSYGKLTADLEKAYNNAKTEYEKKEEMYEREELSAERLAYYEGLMNDAEAALEAAQEENFAKYRDGQFWGYANNAVFKYFEKQMGVFQETEPKVSFDYLIIDDVICVDANSFK